MEERQQSQQKTGELIAQKRKALGLTQKELAARLLISDKTVSKWEAGGGYPEVTLLAPLAAALGLTVDELLAGQESGPHPASPAPAGQNAQLWLASSIRQKYALTVAASLMLMGVWITLAATKLLEDVWLLPLGAVALFGFFATCAWYVLRCKALAQSPQRELVYGGVCGAVLLVAAVFTLWCSTYGHWWRAQGPNGNGGYLKGQELLDWLDLKSGLFNTGLYGLKLYLLALGLAAAVLLFLWGYGKKIPLRFALALPLISGYTVAMHLWLAARLRDAFPLELSRKEQNLPPNPLFAYFKQEAFSIAILLAVLVLLCLVWRRAAIRKLALGCGLLYGTAALVQGLFFAVEVSVQKYGTRYYSWAGNYSAYNLLIGLVWGLAAYHLCAIWAAPKET